MIRAEIRLSSDGVQLVCPLFQGERLICVFAGSEENVIWTLQSYGVGIADVTGLTEELRALWAVTVMTAATAQKERSVEL